ncbi:efflux RND transporter periplasmic adaptor subunit [Rhizobium sp. TRM95111]|uniref:efflux RND transporter periplasmic adaptor subunit n=1 Tax=Rhizobium alarense TaxID=2846851 RepID=UPI001F34EA1D|nr:efflux RND transporter periplasmic adaptor subunit [Rhizobium alarense]MCF3642478.1 efflux RND transporter periplasmic adaptor subunit [Rhizobium alarense]
MSIRRSMAALLVGSAVLSSCQKQDEAPPQPVRPVLFVIARQTPVASLQLTGTVEPKIESQLGFRVLGRMIARNVQVGDLVKKGDVVAAIDPLALELAVRTAQSDVSNAQAQLRYAITTEDRQRTLAEARSGTEAAREEAEQGRKSASASLAKAQANLDKAEEQLSYARLRAEFDGVVTATSAEVGQIVSAGQAVVTVARPEERDAVVDVPLAAAQRLKPGMPFEVTLQLDSSIRAHGVVREIAPQADAATRTQRIKIGLADPPEAFRLGSVITASATISAEAQILLPSSAVLEEKGSVGVWRVDPAAKTVTLQSVKIAGELVPGGTVRVIEGVQPGDRIVTAGIHTLKDGQAVRIDQEVSE